MTSLRSGAAASVVLLAGHLPAAAAELGVGADLSPLAMVLGADWVVKSVMALLAAASLATWTIFFAKGVELRTAERRIAETLRLLAAKRSLAEAVGALDHDHGPGRALLDAVAEEIAVSGDGADASGLKERVASRLARVEVAAVQAVSRGTGLLATVGSTAPFVGLFGTVWGIMNSFVGIARAQTTNLAVVAPGIAEALFATAIGLVAAIPAVVLYNQLSRRIAAYRNAVADTSAAVTRVLSRELDRHGAPRAAAAE